MWGRLLLFVLVLGRIIFSYSFTNYQKFTIGYKSFYPKQNIPSHTNWTRKGNRATEIYY